MILTVVDYNPNWPNAFEQEAIHLRALLGELLVEIHHIGSTAVPNLKAKPIIDMMPEVTSLAALDDKSEVMIQLGYEVMGEMGIPGRRYFRKGGEHRTHQVHAFVAGDPNIQRHLAFRDYLRTHKEIAAEYGALKSQIAQNTHNNIEKYWQAKAPFIQFHESKALAWYDQQNN
ncbi:MAG: GrpB family protein [Bacteroidota bacterium]